jgi:hypothetical protein
VADRYCADDVRPGIDPEVAVRLEIEVEVERPQDLAYPIRAREPIALIFAPRDVRPSVLALRADFPDTPHQNRTPVVPENSIRADSLYEAEIRHRLRCRHRRWHRSSSLPQRL